MDKSIAERKPSKIFFIFFNFNNYFGTNGQKSIAERKPSKIFLNFWIIILAQMDKIHCRKDTFQDVQQHTLNMSDLVPGASSSPKRVQNRPFSSYTQDPSHA
jgi:hypothetical protein